MAIVVALFGTFGFNPQALAASITWTGANNTVNWADANWTGGNGSSLTAGDSITFSSTNGTEGATLTDNEAAGFGISGITYSAGALAYTVNGSNSIALTGGITNNGASLETLNMPIAMGATQTVTLTTGGGNVALGGVVSGAGYGITTAGAGMLTLSGVDTFTGAITIGAGTTLAIGGAGLLNSGVNPGAITDAGTFNYGSTASQTISTAIGGTGGGVTVSGGTLALSANVQGYTGPTVVGNGTLILGENTNATNEGLNNSSSLTINSGGTVQVNYNNGLEGYGTATSIQSITVNAGGALTYVNAPDGITIKSPLNLDGGALGGTGTVNTKYGTWDIQNPIAVNGGATESTISANGVIPLEAGGLVLNVTSGGIPIDLNVTGTLIYGTSDADTGIIKEGNGTMELSNAGSDYKGATTIENGTLIVAAASGALGSATSAVNLGDANTATNNYSASLLIDGGNTVARTVTVSNNATTGTYTIGGGTDSNNTFSGAITVNQPLTVSQVANAGSNHLTISGGITSAGGVQAVTFAGPGNINVGTTAIGNGAGTISTVITGGTTTFGVAAGNTYGGGTTISSGNLVVSNTSGSATGSGGVAANGGTLSGSGIISGTVTDGGGIIAPGAVGTQLTLGGLTYNSGTLSFALNGAGSGTSSELLVANAAFNAAPTIVLSSILNPGSIVSGETFTLISSQNPITGSGLSGLGALASFGRINLTASVSGDSIIATASGQAANLSWAGGVAGLLATRATQGNGSTWNNTQNNSASNFNNAGNYDYFYNADNVTFNDTGSPTHTVNLTTANLPGTVTVNTATSYTFTGTGAGAIAGAGSLAVTSGTLNLNLANSYSGGTSISAGATLKAGVAGAVPGTGTVTLAGNLDLFGNNQTIGALSDGGVSTGIITNSASGAPATVAISSGTASYGGVIQDGSSKTAVAIGGTAVQTLNGTSTYSGGTTLNSGGALVLGSASAIGSGALNINGGSLNSSLSGLTLSANNAVNLGGSFTFAGANSLNLGAGPLTLTASPTITISANSLTVGGVIGGTGLGITVNGGGTLALGALNTYTGGTTISGGNILLNNVSALVNSPVTISVANGLTFAPGLGGAFNIGGLAGGSNEQLDDTGGSPVTLVVGAAGASTTYSGVLSDGAGAGGGLTLTSGTLAITASQAYHGPTVVNGGLLLLSIGNNPATGGLATSSGLTVNNGGAVEMNGDNALVGYNNAIGALPVTINAGGTITNNPAGDAGGTGWTGNFKGLLTLDGGTLAGGSTGAGGEATLYGVWGLQDGVIVNGGTNTSIISAADVNPRQVGGTIFNVASGGTASGIDLNITGTLIKGTATGYGDTGIIKTGNGTMELSNAGNYYTGANVIEEGTLVVAAAAPSGANGALGNATSAITLGDANTNIGNFSASLLIDGGYTVGRAITVSSNATTGVYSIGGGTDSNNTFSGAITVNEPLTVSQVANAGANVLTISGGITSGGGLQTVTFAGPGNVNVTTNGIADGGGQISIVIASGTTTYSAANTYSGTTTVSGGTLVVAGSIGATSSLAINGGAVDLNAANALNATAHLTLSAGTLATLANETQSLGDLTLGSGASVLSLGATGSIINFADSSADTWTGTLAITNWNGNGVSLNGGGSDQVIFANDDLTVAQLADIRFLNPTINGVGYSGSFKAVELSSGELVAAIPEPGTWASLLFGIGFIAISVRRRRPGIN